MVLEKLKALELHDVPVSELIFNFKTGCIKIILEKYDDEKDGYNYVSLVFENITKINSSEFFYSEVRNLEITDANFSIIEGKFISEIIFLRMPGENEWKLNFQCVKVIIKQ